MEYFMPHEPPLVSVIMPAYNAAGTLRESIDSILSQTCARWELIVVDDASTDGTAAVARAYADKDPRVRYFINERNVGAALARNRGINLAAGNYIAFLDSDDIWREDKLLKQSMFMETRQAAISYTATAYIQNSVLSGYILRAKPILTYKELLKRNLMSCSSVMVRREFITRTPFSQGKHHEDYSVWLQILREVGCAYGLDEPLLTYRSNRSSKSGRLSRSGLMTYHSYRHVGYLSFFAFLLTVRYALHSVSKRFLVRMGTS
jgi:teichuronic acid biosynthesis glycosyltransferase TuaG